MEYLKQSLDSNIFTVVDVYNKKKYTVQNYLKFLMEIDTSGRSIAEVPLFPSPLIVDVDIKIKGNKPVELYDEFVVEDLITDYVKVLKEFILNPPKEFKILLLEKKPRVVDGNVKHGFHLHFINIIMNKEDLKIIFNEVKNRVDINTKQILDDVSSKPWLLYGCAKTPQDEPYQITKGYIFEKEIEEVDYEDIFIGSKYQNILITKENINKMLIPLMSIRNVKNLSIQKYFEVRQDKKMNNFLKDKNLKINTEAMNKQVLNNPVTKHVNVSLEKIGQIVMSLNSERAESYNTWINVCLLLTSISKSKNSETYSDFLRGVWHLFSKQSSKYNDSECDEKWNSLMKTSYDGGMGIGTLIHWAKEDGSIKDVKDVLFDYSLEKIPTNDYVIANMIKETITDLYITHKEFGCYKYDGSIWKEVSGWENVFKNIIISFSNEYIPKIYTKIDEIKSEINHHQSDGIPDEEELYEMEQKKLNLKKYTKSIESFSKKIKNYSSLNNIVKSLYDLYFDQNFEKIFTQKETMICFRNCVFDYENWKILPPSPDYFFSSRIEHDLVDWSEVPEDSKEFVEDFYKKIFPDEELREYCLHNFARFFTGKNSFKQFQFWTGEGDNGKSMCISVMENIFGKYSMKVPKAIITGAQQKQGSANPELYRLKDARLAIIDEVTNNDILDPGQIKGLTGNDKLYGRDLYQRSKEIKEITPMFFPILITNEIPIIKRPDDATWGRIRLVRFESTFKRNVEEYLKSHPHADPSKVFPIEPRMHEFVKKHSKYFASYLMKKVFEFTSFEDFNSKEVLPKKVIQGLENFKEGQNILTQFLDENYIIDLDSSEIISVNKILKEYKAGRPKVILTIEEVKTGLVKYADKHPGLVFNENTNTIKGLSRVMF